jgi:hypothetical protein
MEEDLIVIMERSEALSLLRKWLDESTLLTCRVTFKGLAVGMACRLLSVGDEFVDARSDDGLSVIRVTLGRVVVFHFGDSREYPERQHPALGMPTLGTTRRSRKVSRNIAERFRLLLSRTSPLGPASLS